MTLSVSSLVLRAKQLETDAVRHLAGRVELVDVIGQLIHALQHERGTTSIFLASSGQQFAAERQTDIAQVEPIEARLRELFETQLAPEGGASARMLSLMAWVVLDLDALKALRQRMGSQPPSAHDAVALFSRVIAGLVELVFHLADATMHPGVSRQMVAIVHLIQGKEAAGQERAVGAQLFASGLCDEAQQQRIVHLIDAQERSLKVFEDFTDPQLKERWQQHQLTPKVALLERLRRTLCTAKPHAVLDKAQSAIWFDVTSERISAMWQLEQALVLALRAYCDEQLQSSEQGLQDAEALLKQLRNNPPPHTHAVERFFNAAGHPGAAPVLPTMADGHTAFGESAPGQNVSSLTELLQSQSARLASMEVELEAARRALHERKLIERAKGALMSKLGLTEEAAFRALQKAAMDHNKRLADVAEATLSLPDFAFAKLGASGQA